MLPTAQRNRCGRWVVLVPFPQQTLVGRQGSTAAEVPLAGAVGARDVPLCSAVRQEWLWCPTRAPPRSLGSRGTAARPASACRRWSPRALCRRFWWGATRRLCCGGRLASSSSHGNCALHVMWSMNPTRSPGCDLETWDLSWRSSPKSQPPFIM